MSRTRSLTSRLAVVAGAALVLSLAATSVPLAQNNAPYVIGAVLTISGSGANFGQPSAEAIRLLVKNTNDHGGIKGHQVELRLQDDGGDTQRARAAFAQLADDKNVVAIIGSSASPASLAIKPIANDKQIPDLTLGSSPQLSHPPTPYVFQFPVPTAFRARALFDEMKRRHIGKIAEFVSNDDYGQVSEKVLDAEAKRADVTIVDVERFNALGANVDSEVTRAKSKDVQGFIVFSADPGSALVAKSMVNQGVSLTAFFDSPAVNPGFLQAAGPAAAKWYVVTTKIDIADLVKPSDPSYKAIQALVKLYPAGQTPPNHFSGTGADAYNVLAAALAKVGPDRVKLRQAIEDTKNFDGATGVYTFSPDNHQGVGNEGLELISGDGSHWKLASR
jgi:branched-chain amino acid transport system substrate-binding protein